MTTRALAVACFAAVAFSAWGCGGSQARPDTQAPAAGAPAPAAEVKAASHACGSTDKVQQHDLNGAGPSEALVPCSKDGANDYSGAIKIESIPEGIHITVNATDDEVNTGALGADVKTRDAVIVYANGPKSKAIEVPLIKTKDGYVGDKIVLFEDLGKLTDEGTKLDIAVFDHDAKSGQPSEELHVQVAVSTGKSCEKARDENPQIMNMGEKNAKPDLTDAQLGAPMSGNAFFSSCGLPNSASADICVAVKRGRPLGVSVNVTPANNRVAACIDRATRHLSFPSSDKLDVVHEHF